MSPSFLNSAAAFPASEGAVCPGRCLVAAWMRRHFAGGGPAGRPSHRRDRPCADPPARRQTTRTAAARHGSDFCASRGRRRPHSFRRAPLRRALCAGSDALRRSLSIALVPLVAFKSLVAYVSVFGSLCRLARLECRGDSRLMTTPLLVHHSSSRDHASPRHLITPHLVT